MTRNAHPRRALVVDDGPLNRKLMTGLLAQMGCVVDTASSGEEALQKFAQGTYDVAFVDLHMPGMGGRKMVAALRESEQQRGAPRMPVIVLTADDAPPPGDQGWFDHFVSKPITSAILQNSLDEVATTGPATENDERPVDIVDEFLDATCASLDRMKRSLAAADFDSIVAEAHAVRGHGLSFGFAMMSAIGTKLEIDAKAKYRPGVERTLLELERCLSCA